MQCFCDIENMYNEKNIGPSTEPCGTLRLNFGQQMVINDTKICEISSDKLKTRPL